MIKPKEVPLGVRVSDKIKKSLDQYCKTNGISRKHFVEQAIKERLIEIMEDVEDYKTVGERLKNPDLVDAKEMERFFKEKFKG